MALNRREAIGKFGSAAMIAALAGCVSGGPAGGDGETSANNGDGNGDGGGGDGSGDGGDTTATTTQAGPTGTAKGWYKRKEEEAQAIKETLDTYNGESRHTIEGSDISDLSKKTTSAIPAGQGPQIFEWAHDWVGDYYQRGFLSDQSDNLDVDLNEFTEAARGAVQFDGAVVGLPHAAETVSLIYNKDVVDSPPETVSDMVSIMEEHHDPKNNSYGLSYPIDPYFASAWAQAFGGYYFDPDEDPMLGLSKSETIDGFELLLDKFVPYIANDIGYGPQVATFGEGNAPFAINGPWFMATANKKGIDAGVAPLPTLDGGEPSPYTGITLWYFAKGMGKGEGKAAAGRDFAQWYATNEDLQLAAAKNLGSIPVLQSLAGSDDLPANVKAFSETVAKGTPMPTHPKMNKVWSPVGDAIAKAVNDSASVEDAMKTAESTIRSNWE